MPRFRKHAEPQRARMNMTSLIDVVFLILIFFMCASRFRAPEGELDAHLPKEGTASSRQLVVSDPCRILLWQSESSGEIVVRVDGLNVPMMAPSGNDPLGSLDRATLHHVVGERFRNYTGLQPRLPVIIDFSGDVPWKHVVTVLDVCREVGVGDVSFAVPLTE